MENYIFFLNLFLNRKLLVALPACHKHTPWGPANGNTHHRTLCLRPSHHKRRRPACVKPTFKALPLGMCWLVVWKMGRDTARPQTIVIFPCDPSITAGQEGGLSIQEGKHPLCIGCAHADAALQTSSAGQKPKCGQALVPRQPGEVKTSHWVKKSQYQARKSVANYFKQLVFFNL